MIRSLLAATALLAALPLFPSGAGAHPIKTKPSEATRASFDIVETTVVVRDGIASFTTRVHGEAGKDKPDATGRFEGSRSGFPSGTTRDSHPRLFVE